MGKQALRCEMVAPSYVHKPNHDVRNYLQCNLPSEVVNSHLSLHGSHCMVVIVSAVDIDYSFRIKGMNTYGYIIINLYI